MTQFAVLDALLAGAYESGISVAAVRERGDFGIGCCEHLGGEVLILDGEVFECTVGEPPDRMREEQILPFVDVCRFPPTDGLPIAGADLGAFTAQVEHQLASRNLFHAVRVDGLFTSVRVRVTPRQEHPFRPLAEVTNAQIETVLDDVRGTLVGFWAPAIYQGIRWPACTCTSWPPTAASAAMSWTSRSGRPSCGSRPTRASICACPSTSISCAPS